jgi:hypothetical protein
VDFVQWYAVVIFTSFVYVIVKRVALGEATAEMALAFCILLGPLFLRIWHLI